MILGRLTDFDGNPVPGRFRVSMRPQPGKLYSGQCVELVAKLMPLASASLPGGYQFDRKSFYLGLSGSGYSESRVLPVDCREPASWRERFSFKVAGWRQSIMEKSNGFCLLMRLRWLLPSSPANKPALIPA